jgi:hypothetical protein
MHHTSLRRPQNAAPNVAHNGGLRQKVVRHVLIGGPGRAIGLHIALAGAWNIRKRWMSHVQNILKENVGCGSYLIPKNWQKASESCYKICLEDSNLRAPLPIYSLWNIPSAVADLPSNYREIYSFAMGPDIASAGSAKNFQVRHALSIFLNPHLVDLDLRIMANREVGRYFSPHPKKKKPPSLTFNCFDTDFKFPLCPRVDSNLRLLPIQLFTRVQPSGASDLLLLIINEGFMSFSWTLSWLHLELT